MAKKHSATFIGVGNSLVILNGHCYAYSGEVSSGGGSALPVTKMLEFTTPSEPIRAIFNVTNDVTSVTSDVSYKIDFNGITILNQILKDEISKQGGSGHQGLELVIPPHTLIECYADTAADPHLFTWMIAGKIL